MSSTAAKAVVVGGGAIGAASAYYLATRFGWKTTLLEKGTLGGGCSHANCGYVCPSHVLPLNKPGSLGSSMVTALRPGSPLRIRPRLDPQLWSWLWRFARRCRADAMLEAGAGRHALLESSARLYLDLIEAEGIDCDWEKRGLLFVHRERSEFEEFSEIDELLRDRFGVGAERLDAKRLAEFEPSLKPDLAGAWYYDCDAHLRADRLLAGLGDALRRHGVEIVENCQVSSFERSAGGAHAVRTSRGEHAADVFVLAAGAWTPHFRRELGCPVPIQPGKGYSITMPRPEPCPTYPMIFEQDHVAMTPMRSGYRLGSMMEIVGYDDSIRPERLRLLGAAAERHLRVPTAEPIEERWFGWRPMSADGMPIISRSPRLPNVLIAAGHSMLGISMAPATGRLVAEMLSEAETHIDPSPYSVERF